MGGMSIGLMGNAEQATITNIQFSGTPNLVATVQNTGKSPVTINWGYVNNAPNATFTSTTIAASGSATFALIGPAYVSGDQVTVKMTTAKGNNLVLTETVP